MKIYKLAYFIDNSAAYLIDGNNVIEDCEKDTHFATIINKYGLEPDIKKQFYQQFHKKLDWNRDWEHFISFYVEDFMEENRIFPVVVDFKEKKVFVRPVKEVNPSESQIHALSDWAIEHGWNEDIMVDIVTAGSNAIYKTSSAVIKEDPRLMEAAKRVVEFGELEKDMVDEYHFVNPQDLTDVVQDMQKEKTLPIAEILRIVDENHITSIEKIARMSKVPMDDAIWVIRHYRPNFRIKVSPKEIEEIIKLKEQGILNSKIVEKTRVDYSVINGVLKKYRPDLVHPTRPKGFWDNFYSEFLTLTENEGKTRPEATKILMEKYNIEKNEQNQHSIDVALLAKGLKPKPLRPLSPEEQDLIKTKLFSGMPVLQIAKDINRNYSVVLNHVKKYHSDYYEENIKNSITPEISRFVVNLIQNGKDDTEIKYFVKATYKVDISDQQIKWRRHYHSKKQKATDFPVSEIPQEKEKENEQPPPEPLPQPETLPFGGISVKPVSPEEYERRKQRFVTKEELERMERLERKKKPVPVATNINWYKIAKQTDHHYSWVYIDIPKEICDIMKEFGKEIDPNDLFEEEADNGLENEFHITVKYGMTGKDVKEIKECLDGLKKGKAYLGSSSIFECEKYDVVKISVESEVLNKLHENLNKLPHEDKHMEYEPHATIAYVKKGCGKKYKSKFKVNKEFKFKEVYFGNNKKDYTIKLAKTFNWYKVAKIDADPGDVDELGEQQACDFMEKRDEHYQKILQEYYDKKRKKGTMMSWSVIPFARLRKIWTDYSKTGVVRDERGMRDIANQMIEILARLNASNDLAGHGQYGSHENIQDITGYKMPHGKNTDFYFDFLETPYGSPVSDFGLPQLNEIAAKLQMAKTSEQQLLFVDQMLNVVHQRGDLAALFIEGGSTSLEELANG